MKRNERPAFAVLWISAVSGGLVIGSASSALPVAIGCALIVFSLVMAIGGALTHS